MRYIFYENVRYFSLLFGEYGLDDGVHFTTYKKIIALSRLVDKIKKVSYNLGKTLIYKH
jgi:hypothetical protein